jgi:DHHC palmitoyltransferase
VWLGTCIGKRNYKMFIYFVSTLSSMCLYISAMAVLSIAIRVAENNGNTGLGVGQRWYSIIFCIYATIVSFHS